MLLGGYLTLLIGPTVPIPAPAELAREIEQVSVQQSERGRSGFQLSFRMGRDSFLGAVDFPPLLKQLVKVGHRVILMVTINARPQVLIDGLITNLQLSPGAEAGSSRLTVTGEDISLMMDLLEMKTPYPGLGDYQIVQVILAKYAAYAQPLAPFPPPGDMPRSPTEQTAIADGTDYAILTRLAEDYGFVFFVIPGLVPGQNTAYWGPPFTVPNLQSALTFRMGSASNVGSIQFTTDGNKPEFVYGLIQEKHANVPTPVVGVPTPPMLSAVPAYAGNLPFVRVKLLRDDCGGDVVAALGKATAQMWKSNRNAVTASGELDVGRYGGILRARELVGVRGVGLTFDGAWYVSSVSHSIARGSYTQSFSLERDGTISNTPVVMP